MNQSDDATQDMANSRQRNEQQRRLTETLTRSVGPDVMRALSNLDVVEIYLNPGGALFFDTYSAGRVRQQTSLRSDDVHRFLNAAASALNVALDAGQPMLQGELPQDTFQGARLQAFVPPVVPSPCFNLRKPARRLYPLSQYVADGVLARTHHQRLQRAVAEHSNILIAGGTASGKTTLLNALLSEVTRQYPQERIAVLEDTVEISCAAVDTLSLRTCEGVTLADLVKAALRTSPNRIVVGEVRDAAALDLCDAWSTGHPGGLSTLHATDPLGALYRLDRLAQRNRVPPQAELVGQAINLVVIIAGGSTGRSVTDVVEVRGFDGSHFVIEPVPSLS